MWEATNTNYVWRNFSYTVAPHYIKQNVEKLHSWIQSEYYEWSFIIPMVLLIKIGNLNGLLSVIRFKFLDLEFIFDELISKWKSMRNIIFIEYNIIRNHYN